MSKKTTPWFVKEVKLCGKVFYQVRRIICINGDPLATRTEKRGGYYEHKIDADRLAETLNGEAADNDK